MSEPEWNPEIVWVPSPSDFPPILRSDEHNVCHGYVVRGSGAMDPTPWMFFTSVEPAYVYGRALRMAGPIRSWDMRLAALDTGYDSSAAWFDRRTLYIARGPAPERFDLDDDLLTAFHEGVDRNSSHWPRATDVNHHR